VLMNACCAVAWANSDGEAASRAVALARSWWFQACRMALRVEGFPAGERGSFGEHAGQQLGKVKVPTPVGASKQGHVWGQPR
jgi:hypothetical protein